MAQLPQSQFMDLFWKILHRSESSPVLLRPLLSAHNVERVPGHTWASILDGLVQSEIVGTHVKALMKSTEIMDKISNTDLRNSIDAALRIAHAESFFEALAENHLASRLSGLEWEHIISNLLNSAGTQILKKQDIVQRLTPQGFHRAVQQVISRSSGDPELASVLLMPHIFDKISGNEWGEILLNQVNSQRVVATLLKEPLIIAAIPESYFKALIDALLFSVRDYGVTTALASPHIVNRVSGEIWNHIISRYLSDKDYRGAQVFLNNPNIMIKIPESLKMSLYRLLAHHPEYLFRLSPGIMMNAIGQVSREAVISVKKKVTPPMKSSPKSRISRTMMEPQTPVRELPRIENSAGLRGPRVVPPRSSLPSILRPPHLSLSRIPL